MRRWWCHDPDLAFAIAHARTKVPVGMINPRGNPTAGALRGKADDGVGRHWWHRLTVDEFYTGTRCPSRSTATVGPPLGPDRLIQGKRRPADKRPGW